MCCVTLCSVSGYLSNVLEEVWSKNMESGVLEYEGRVCFAKEFVWHPVDKDETWKDASQEMK